MSKNTNLSFLTDYITADITNGRIGINNASPTYAFDVTGIARTSTSTYLATDSGNVGIGTTTPNQILSVRKTSAGSETIALALQNIGGTANTAVAMIFCPHENSTTPEPLAKISAIRTAASGALTDLAFYTFITPGGLTERMRINSDGSVAMLATPTTANAANVHMTVGGTIFRSTSSLKYKNTVTDYDKGLDIVNQLRPVYYKGNKDGDTIFAGLIAEEVHELGLTEFVQYAKDGSPDSLAYPNMVALLIKSIQELSAEITILKNK